MCGKISTCEKYVPNVTKRKTSISLVKTNDKNMVDVQIVNDAKVALLEEYLKVSGADLHTLAIRNGTGTSPVTSLEKRLRRYRSFAYSAMKTLRVVQTFTVSIIKAITRSPMLHTLTRVVTKNTVDIPQQKIQERGLAQRTLNNQLERWVLLFVA